MHGRARPLALLFLTRNICSPQSGKKSNAVTPLFFLLCTMLLPILAGKEPWEVVVPMHIGVSLELLCEVPVSTRRATRSPAPANHHGMRALPGSATAFPDVLVALGCAALAGLGLLHVGSGHRLMTEFLLSGTRSI